MTRKFEFETRLHIVEESISRFNRFEHPDVNGLTLTSK